jgi:hypothetical protein
MARKVVALHLVRVVLGEPEVEGGDRGDGSGDADRGLWTHVSRDAMCEQFACRRAAGVELFVRWRIGVQEPLGQPNAAHIQAVVKAEALRFADDKLRRAAADVDHERVLSHVAPRRGTAES